MESFYDTIPGYACFADVTKEWARTLPDDTVMVEVGVHNGKSLFLMALERNRLKKPMTIYAVDQWDYDKFHDTNPGPEKPEECFDRCKSLFKSEYVRIVKVKATSLQAAAIFAEEQVKFNFIFIDAGHDYNEAHEDILAWRPLLSPGGLFAGHDYCPISFPGVIQAVDELIPKHRLTLRSPSTVWVQEAESV